MHNFVFQTMKEPVHDVGSVSSSTLMEAMLILKNASIIGRGPIPARVSCSSFLSRHKCVQFWIPSLECVVSREC